jgi:hypothetical protein
MIVPPDATRYRRKIVAAENCHPNRRREIRGPDVWSMLVLLCVSLCIAGCGRKGPPPRKLVPISGTVTLDGKPLPDGFVSFVSPTEGYLESFPINEGKFSGKAGLGVQTVDIIAVRESKPPSGADGAQAPPTATRTNYLPSKYSMNSPLRADVTEAGPNTFTFELTMGK